MIITGGKYKGKKIKTSDGLNVRPSSGMLKQGLFNMIQKKVSESMFLDLYSGSGAVGLEAISRGADKVIFVEKDFKNSTIIKQNIASIDPKINHILLTSTAENAIAQLNNILFDIIFLDPPYNKINLTYIQEIFNLIMLNNILNKEGLLILEFSEGITLKNLNINNLKLIKEKTYGKSKLGLWHFEP